MEPVRICPRCRRINRLDVPACTDCGAGLERAAVTQYEEPDPLPVEVDPLSCPACGVPMHSGEAFVHFPPLLWNWNALWMKVLFRLRGRREEAVVMHHGEKRRAARCPRCGGVWIVSTLVPHPRPW